MWSSGWSRCRAPWREVYGSGPGPDPVCRQEIASGAWASTCGTGSGDTWTPGLAWPQSCFDGTDGYRHQLAQVMGYPQNYAEIPAVLVSAVPGPPANWSWAAGGVEGTAVNTAAVSLSWTWQPAFFEPDELAVELLAPCASGKCVVRRFEPTSAGNQATWSVAAWALELGHGQYTARLVLNGSYGGHRVESEEAGVYDSVAVDVLRDTGSGSLEVVEQGINQFVLKWPSEGLTATDYYRPRATVDETPRTWTMTLQRDNWQATSGGKCAAGTKVVKRRSFRLVAFEGGMSSMSTAFIAQDSRQAAAVSEANRGLKCQPSVV